MEKICKVNDCKRKSNTSMDVCLMHYKRYKRHNSFELPERQPKKCSYCNRVQVSRGMCNKHYQNWQRHGDALYTDKIRKIKQDKPNKYGYLEERGKNHRVVHRNIVEQMLGKHLNSNDIVHHIDIDKSNNQPENLYVCSRSEHQNIHKQLERIASRLIKREIIDFENGEYQ